MRISVAIPCFNASAYLEEALASVFAQDRAPFEVVVVDDGSTDGSAAIIEGFGSRVRYERQDHQGIGAARNRAVHLTRGDTIAFLDADDLWTPHSLQSRAKCLKSDGSLDGAFGLVEQFISPELSLAGRHDLGSPCATQAGRLAGAMLLRRHVFDRVGPFDTTIRVGETIDWLARADTCGIVMQSIDEVVLQRRIHPTNTGRTHQHTRTDYLRVLRASIDRRRSKTSAGPVD